MQPVCNEEKSQCKAMVEVGDFVAVYPSMDQNYVTTNVVEAVEQAWEQKE